MIGSKVKQIKGNPVFFDVDETLIMHTRDLSSSSTTVKVYCEIEGRNLIFRVNEPMVRLLKEEHAKGAFVFVWSRGGNQWATDVIKALDLEYYVNLTLDKPLVYFDDKPVEEWLIYRVYLSPDTVYKP